MTKATSNSNKKPPNDPFDIFVNAWGFQSAATVLDQRKEKNVFAWPSVVNGALSLELYLKCLLFVRKSGADTRTHDCRILYGKLSKADQRRIRVRLKRVLDMHPLASTMRKERILLDVDSILTRARGLFDQQRYWHEYKPLARDSRGRATTAGIEPLTNALLVLLRELHPEWEKRFQEFALASNPFKVSHKYTPLPT